MKNIFQQWFNTLERLGLLPDGWDSYSAPAPGQRALVEAHSYLTILENLNWAPSRLEASVMGGIGITHRLKARKVYVEFYNNGAVHALFSDHAGSMQTVPVGTVSSYYRFLGVVRKYLDG